jgi:hypothetical protein
VQADYNLIKEIVADGLAEEGYISKAEAEEIKENFMIISYQKGWLGRTIDKVWGLKEKVNYVRLVKVLGHNSKVTNNQIKVSLK